MKMTKKELKNLCEWLDERYAFVQKWEQEHKGEKNEIDDDYGFARKNPNFIYYKGMVEMLRCFGNVSINESGKHEVWLF